MLRAVGRRNVSAALLIAALTSLFLALPQFDRLRGLSIDVLTWLRWKAVGTMHSPQSSPTVVIALDEETYRRKPFEGTPNVTWTREIGVVLDAVLQGGAKVIGMDVIFPTSIEQSEMPFEDGTLGGRVRGFDRDFLRVLAKGARADRIVLGQVQHQDHPIQPSPGQRIAVGQQANIRALNFHLDSDEIVRRMPFSFVTDGMRMPSMSAELAARALGVAPDLSEQGQLTLGNHRVATQSPNTFALNFEGGADDIPTYSLADLRECANKSDSAFFRSAFEGRVVLLGAVLDLEDRAVSSKRLATGTPQLTSRCVLPAPTRSQAFARASIPGVYIHATAINNLIRGEELREPGRFQTAAGTFLLALAASIAALTTSPPIAVSMLLGLIAVWTAAAVSVFTFGFVVPFIDASVASVLALAVTVGHRFVIADKDKRMLRRNFALYLPASIIDKMLTSSKPPALGGETRNVTVLFSDLAGFSAFSEQLNPSELVNLINVYLTAMTDVIEGHGGFVDKFIGDGIVAVFGAPLDDEAHAKNAVCAALACEMALKQLNQELPFVLRQRIGLNTGEVLVGNLGSRRRFNYTVMGDAVNLASRLEGANKFYGTAIIASEHTASAASNGIIWRELDTIRVVGRGAPVTIFEPLAIAGEAMPGLVDKVRLYDGALTLWRGGDFDGVCTVLKAASPDDVPAQHLLRRAETFRSHPLPADWDAVTTLDGK
ncbi:CHASE2 domain-containing protein [Leptospira interrogans]